MTMASIAMALALVWLTIPLAHASVPEGRVVEEVLHSKALETTATGESADRHVTIYLPPSYESQAMRRFPVIYLLHGIGDTDSIWTKGKSDWTNIKSVMDRGIANGDFGEMIVVMPDERTKWFGSFYTNSASTGLWGDFTVKDLVGFIDGHFRTLATAGGRGITGHSMGGYGALKLAMTHPHVFSAVYGMNAALIGWGGEITPEDPAFIEVPQAKTFAELLPGGANTVGLVTIAQAFSPNPKHIPFFADLPFKTVDGKMLPAEPAFSAWESNFLPNMVASNRQNLLQLRGIRFDSGTNDEFHFIPIGSRTLSAAFTANGIDHVFEEYNGDHRNRMWGEGGRLHTEVLPFFWRLLDHGL